MNIDEKILNYKEDLDYFEDKMDKYKYLIVIYLQCFVIMRKTGNTQVLLGYL